ncbi:hypothetical protein HYH03_000029 [Edaphochlamys debaryana]|uniref:Ankyrin repeat domain-containing protein n=1 Tax=Edaphochlamys debaryana TaxID=47281 RepID=A0A836C793_9CHLO|nr:hypothetical protein HYH03_000029 [Edaphochlamys debaryana]|eukprot:KAG2501522.1 hypothetical protein HYH03_000029 [Edaphochlamys debaryana]
MGDADDLAALPHVWLPEIVARIARFLPATEVAGTLRLVDSTSYRTLGAHCVIRLGELVPSHAFAAQWGRPGAAESLSLAARRELLLLTSSTGSVANLELAEEALGLELGAREFGAAISAGHVGLCEGMAARHPRGAAAAVREWAAQGALAAMAAAGSRTACTWLLERGAVPCLAAVTGAARAGHGALAEWLLGRLPPAQAGPACSERLLLAAAAGLDLDGLQRLYGEPRVARMASGQVQPRQALRGFLSAQWRAALLAAAAGSPTPDWADKVAWLLARGCPVGPAAFEAAAGRPQDGRERLAWLLGLLQRGADQHAAGHAEHAPRLTRRAARAAAACGGAAALEMLLEAGVRPDADAAPAAAAGGHVGVLALLAARGCAVDPSATALAGARAGHVGVLAWLEQAAAPGRASEAGAAGGAAGRGSVEAGAGTPPPWLGADVFNAAAESGRVEAMEWLAARGARGDGGTLAAAAKGGCVALLRMVLEACLCRMPVDGWPYAWAARNGDTLTLGALRALGAPWGPGAAAFTRAVRLGGGVRALAWMVGAGCGVAWAEAVEAAVEQAGAADVLACIARFLPVNEVACSLRLVDKTARDSLKHYGTVRLSQPVPHRIFVEHWQSPTRAPCRHLPREKRRQLLSLTAGTGVLANLQAAAAATGLLLSVNGSGALDAAASAGHIHVCNYLAGKGLAPTASTLVAAASAGRWESLEWCLAKGAPWSCEAVLAAARSGHLGVVRRLGLRTHQQWPHVSQLELIANAALGCSLQDLETLQREGLDAFPVQASLGPGVSPWAQAGLGGPQAPDSQPAPGGPSPNDPSLHPPLPLVWHRPHDGAAPLLAAAAASPGPDWQAKFDLISHLCGCTAGSTTTLDGVPDVVVWRLPENEALVRLEWLRGRGYRPGPCSLDWAIAAGRCRVADWIMSAVVSGISMGALLAAAGRGHVEALQLAAAKRSFWVREVHKLVWVALRGGQVGAAVWAAARMRAQRQELGPQCWAYAAESGSVEALEWVKGRLGGMGPETPQAAQVFRAAVRDGGCEAALEWLAARGCAMGTQGEPYLAAARQGDLRLLALLRRLGCPVGPRRVAAAVREVERRAQREARAQKRREGAKEARTGGSRGPQDGRPVVG